VDKFEAGGRNAVGFFFECRSVWHRAPQCIVLNAETFWIFFAKYQKNVFFL